MGKVIQFPHGRWPSFEPELPDASNYLMVSLAAVRRDDARRHAQNAADWLVRAAEPHALPELVRWFCDDATKIAAALVKHADPDQQQRVERVSRALVDDVRRAVRAACAERRR